MVVRLERLLALVVVVVGLCGVQGYYTDGFNVSIPTEYTVLRSSNRSVLYQVQDPNYSPPPYLIVLRGSHYQIGYDYAYMLAQEMLNNYNTFLSSQIPNGVRNYSCIYN